MIYEQTLLWDKPKAKARPRVTSYGTYTEKATVLAEKNLRDQWLEERAPKFDGPVIATFDFWNDRIVVRIETCDDYTQRKLTGDTDNYIKLVSDSLNGIAYGDDRQIVNVTGRKN